MDRVGRLAQWIGSDILAAQGAARTPDRMAAVMPVAYRLADSAVEAIAEVVRGIAADLAGRHGAVPALGEQVAELDLRAWEAQFAPSGCPECE